MLREEIRQIVRASVHETLGHLGFTVEDPHAVQRDMIYLRRARLRMEEIGRTVRGVAIGTVVTGMLVLLWEALGHSLTGG